MHAAVVYSPGCHLGDKAVELLHEFGLVPRIVDVDGDEDLRRRHGERVPVVVIDGVERFRGRIDVRLLRRILQ